MNNAAVALEPSSGLPKYYGYAPVEYLGYLIGIERVANIPSELEALWRAHWEETETLYLDEPLRPDTELLVRYEAMGQFVVFTVRDKELKLVGELMYFLGPNPHLKGSILAREDAFYLAPAHRKGRLAVKLLQFAEKALADLKVDYVGMSDKAPAGGKSLRKLMGLCGYKPVATYYLKRLGE